MWIGTRCIVLKGSRLGDHCVVVAGSVVAGDIPARSVLAGVFAKGIGRFDVPDKWRFRS